MQISEPDLPELASPGEARFDAALHAWILSTYADVSAALRDPRLAEPTIAYATAHQAVRQAATHKFSVGWLTRWRAEIEPLAYRIADAIPAGRQVDLVRVFAEPWSLAAAVSATGAPEADSARLGGLARDVFLGAAGSSDSALPPRAHQAAAELACTFPGTGASVDVQSFVALSQTLAGFLASAWLALLQHPHEAALLRAEPGLTSHAVEELLRYAGPSRAIFRYAAAPAGIGRANIQKGGRAILLLAAANRDPAQFPEPDRLDLRRGTTGHLAFGGGPHACAGATLIRIALAAATNALLATATIMEPGGSVDWLRGFAIRVPASLPVVLRRKAA